MSVHVFERNDNNVFMYLEEVISMHLMEAISATKVSVDALERSKDVAVTVAVN